MTRSRPGRAAPIPLVFIAFCAGMVFAWWLQAYGPPKPVNLESRSEARPKPDAPDNRTPGPAASPVSGPSESSHAARSVGTSGDIPHGRLQVPIDGADVQLWKGAFYERRNGRPHEAVDILSPRNTPIHAVADGTIAKLFLSKAGGNTIYQFDTNGRLCYYYAHLERYADGLAEGQSVSRGQVIGYVGTSGNARPNAPHLHFAVIQLNADRHWWQGHAWDPYEVFRR